MFIRFYSVACNAAIKKRRFKNNMKETTGERVEKKIRPQKKCLMTCALDGTHRVSQLTVFVFAFNSLGIPTESPDCVWHESVPETMINIWLKVKQSSVNLWTITSQKRRERVPKSPSCGTDCRNWRQRKMPHTRRWIYYNVAVLIHITKTWIWRWVEVELTNKN